MSVSENFDDLHEHEAKDSSNPRPWSRTVKCVLGMLHAKEVSPRTPLHH